MKRWLLLFFLITPTPVYAQLLDPFSSTSSANFALPGLNRASTTINERPEDKLYGKAVRALEDKNFEEAQRQLDLLLTLYPKYTNGYLARGHLLMIKERSDEALKDYETVILANADSFFGWYGKANALAFSLRWNEADQAYSKVLQISPRHRESIEGRALVNFELGRYTLALEGWDALLREKWEARLLLNRGLTHYRLGDSNAAQKDYEAAVKVYTDNKDLAGIKNAQERISLMQQPLLNKEIEKEVMGGDSYNQALSAWNAGDLVQAIALFSQCLGENPSLDRAWANRAMVLIEQKKYNLALADLDQAIRLAPGQDDYWLNRATLRQQTGNLEGALNDYQKALEIRPTAEAYNGRANTLVDLGQYAQANRDYGRAIAQNPQFKEAFFNRAGVRFDLGNFRAACIDLKTAQALYQPQDPVQQKIKRLMQDCR